MIKIWAYLISKEKDKILKETMYSADDKYDEKNFFTYLTEICAALEIPAPVVLDKHTSHFTRFNSTRFKEGDFVENVSFKYLILEAVPEKTKEKPY